MLRSVSFVAACPSILQPNFPRGFRRAQRGTAIPAPASLACPHVTPCEQFRQLKNKLDRLLRAVRRIVVLGQQTADFDRIVVLTVSLRFKSIVALDRIASISSWAIFLRVSSPISITAGVVLDDDVVESDLILAQTNGFVALLVVTHLGGEL